MRGSNSGELTLGKLLQETTVMEYCTIEVVWEGHWRHFLVLVEEKVEESPSTCSSSREDSSSGDESGKFL